MGEAISILLVEDNVDDVAMLRRLIRRLEGSYMLEIAYTGGEAIAKLERHTYDITLLDHHLPDLSGDQLIYRFREVRPELAIVMLTGQGDERLAVEVMKAGAYDYLRKDDLDLRILDRTIRNVLERVRLEQEVKRANERLRDWAIRDGLTGLYNHRHFQELLCNEFARAARYGQPLAFMILDLDHFKRLNDTYGHPFGDEVLRSVAATLLEIARRVDIIARYGGEEFVAILPSTDRDGAAQVAERICKAVEARMLYVDGVSVNITVSIGVSTSRDAGVSDERTLIKRADAALYQAKRGGRNQVRVADGTEELIFTPTPVPRQEAPADLEYRRRFVASLAEIPRMTERLSEGEPTHSQRVAELAVAFGRALKLEPVDLETLEAGALLHDIGRIGVRPGIWLKCGPLADDERRKMERHVEFGAQLIEQTQLLDGELDVVRYHHERWDGTGYPDGLRGSGIPLLARIVALADCFEALVSTRPWRPAFSVDEAIVKIREEAGAAFDPSLTETFLEIARLWTKTREAAG